MNVIRLREIKNSQAQATKLLEISKASIEPVYLVLVFNIQGREHRIINIESVATADKLLSSKYLSKARTSSFGATNRKHNVYYAYPELSIKVASLVLAKKIKKYIEIEFKDEHIFSIMSIYQTLVNKQQTKGTLDDSQLVDFPPIWYEPSQDILYDLYGNKTITTIKERQKKVIKAATKGKQ